MWQKDRLGYNNRKPLKGDFTMKTKTKKRILTILYIVSFVVIAALVYALLPEGYGWFKY